MLQYIDSVALRNKRILLRADFDVSLNPDNTIANDTRISSNLPTIKYLLNGTNRLICVAKLGRPKGRDKKYSLQVVVDRLQKYLPEYKVRLINDFLTEKETVFHDQQPDEVFVLENIRFYPEEKKNDAEFAKRLASLADVYVNDGFAVCHRDEASVTGVARLLQSYGGLLLKKELDVLNSLLAHPKKPFVAIMGGAKIDTKIHVIGKLMEIADSLLVGGALATPFFKARGYNIGGSLYEEGSEEFAKQLLDMAEKKHTKIHLPVDVVLGIPKNMTDGGVVVRPEEIVPNEHGWILDIGPETLALYGAIVANAQTVLWNGPMGYVEHPSFRRGTDFIYYSIAHNERAVSVVGGGDTLATISKKEYIDKITHVSTGGGAMLEYIEKGTLVGIDVLKNSKY